LNVIRSDPNSSVLVHRNVLCVGFVGAQEPAVYRSLYGLALRLASESGTGKVGVVSIVVPGASPPSVESREAIANLHNDPEGIVHRSALVLTSDGFIGAAIRSIAVSILQMATRRPGHDIFQRLDRAVTWVTEGLPTDDAEPIAAIPLTYAIESHLRESRRRVA
jgi:hypothetical protein